MRRNPEFESIESIVRPDQVKARDSILHAEQEENKTIAALDPLDMDDFFREVFPVLNATQDAQELIKQAQRYADHLLGLLLDIPHSKAALRDLGMVAAALQRHGVSLTSVPGLSQSLEHLGNVVDEVPRDTVFSYGPRNPSDVRMRTFTRLPEERIFIDSFREGMVSIDHSLNSLFQALTHDPDDIDALAHLLEQANQSFRGMVDAIVLVRRAISPELFTFQLRPYFDPIEIGEQAYLAPGGAQMPLILIDKLLWGLGDSDEQYAHYFNENLQYLPVEYRNVWQIASSLKQNLLEKVTHAANNPPIESELRHKLLKEVEELFLMLIRFRQPHLTIAKENFALRGKDSLGSGGYDPGILEFLLERTNWGREVINGLINETDMR